jgi:histidinol dehydrogenase
MLEIIDGRSTGGPVYIARPQVPGGEPVAVVKEIVDAVRLGGDAALVELTQRFDEVTLTSLRVPEETIAASRGKVPPELLDACEVMVERLRATHERQLPKSWMDERPDETIGEIVRPLRRAGIYVPGGRAAYPSSVVMGAVPAQVAGVGGLAVCTPPGPDGSIPDAVLAACAVVGISEVYRIGGAQAIAALAYGTESVRPVDKIVGPGNIYVTLAKRSVAGWVGIDSEAGPSEIAVVADDSARPEVIAADLVAQAEHGPHGVHALITWSQDLVDKVIAALDRQLLFHPRAEDVENALIEGGRAVIVNDQRHAFETANALAPEHLQLMFPGARAALDEVHNAGAVFVGEFTPVPAGDYVAGTNHVLPAGGTARWASGLGPVDFVKRIYVAELERSALERLAVHIDALAEAEGLSAHARAVRIRLGEEDIL